MIKYAVLFNSQASLEEGNVYEIKEYNKLRIIYDITKWALPLNFSIYHDRRYRRHRGIVIDFLCLHFVIEKYEF